MAKKKSKGKQAGKKDGKQKKDQKKKTLKKKHLTKKQLAKLEARKDSEKIKSGGKKKAKSGKKDKTSKKVGKVSSFSDLSTNYNVRDGLRMLRSLQNPEDIEKFITGETRSTIMRSIPGVKRKFEEKA